MLPKSAPALPAEKSGQARSTASKKVELTVRAVAQAIVQGEYAPGNLLSSESDLGRRYNVSRPLVREAIARLVNLGMVETRHGIGSYVKQPAEWQILEPFLLQLLIDLGHLPDIGRELVELRASIEVEAARSAAQHITPKQLQQLESWLQQMDTSLEQDVETFARADVAFHNVMISSTENRFFMQIMNKLAYPLITARRLTSQLGGLPSRTEAQMWHRRIFEAIAARDAAAAADAMRNHITQLDSVIKQAFAMMSAAAVDNARASDEERPKP